MRTEDFDYHLPEELIAQEPMMPRDACKLLVMHRNEGKLDHRHFYDIDDYLQAGDLLVVNETRVLPARLQGKRADTGGAVEVLLLKELDKTTNTWECLAKPGKRVREGAVMNFYESAELGVAGEVGVPQRTPQRKMETTGSIFRVENGSIVREMMRSNHFRTARTVAAGNAMSTPPFTTTAAHPAKTNKNVIPQLHSISHSTSQATQFCTEQTREQKS